MGWISVIFAHKAIDLATFGKPHSAVRRTTLFRSAGVDPQAPVDPKVMIPDTAFFELLERIVRDDESGRAIPVRIGASMRCDDYGAFGLAFKSAVDLIGSYRRVERYGKIVTSIANFRVVPAKGTAFMEVIPDSRTRLGLTMTNELAVAAATALSREVCRQAFRPEAVYFTHAAPKDNAIQEAYFKCPIFYASDRDALEVSDSVLRNPNRLGDSGISEFFAAHLDQELAEFDDHGGLGRRVKAQISEALSEGVPAVSQVAARLGMSSRTLQRRLADAGFAYQELVADARRELAEQLLRKSDYALAEIAFLTGFSEQSTFTRAFKRWCGQTPAAYRRNA